MTPALRTAVSEWRTADEAAARVPGLHPAVAKAMLAAAARAYRAVTRQRDRGRALPLVEYKA